jgi:GT2 family glycosyltransferase
VLRQCLDSVIAQDCDFSFEIIVHDDASSDDSLAILAQHYPDVTVIAGYPNAGFCIANNRMAERARGEYLLLLNNDAWLAPDALRNLADHARGQQEPGILGLAQYDATSGELVDVGSMLDPFYNPIPNVDANTLDVGHIIGACMWVPRPLWGTLGGFPPWFHTLAEDLYLSCRARLAGYSVQALTTSRFYHLIGHTLGGGKTSARVATTYKRRQLTERNKCFVAAVCTPQPAFPVLFGLHLFALIMEGLLFSLVKWDRRPLSEIYWPALAGVWRERTRLHAERKAAQAGRRIGCLRYFSPFTPLPFKLTVFLRRGIPELR